MGLSETKKKGSGEVELDNGFVLRYSGVGVKERAKRGVAIIVDRDVDKEIVEWEPVSSRTIKMILEIEKQKIGLIQIYAPTDD